MSIIEPSILHDHVRHKSGPMSEAKSTIVPYAYHRSFRYRQQLTWKVPISNDDLVPVAHSSQHLEAGQIPSGDRFP